METLETPLDLPLLLSEKITQLLIVKQGALTSLPPPPPVPTSVYKP